MASPTPREMQIERDWQGRIDHARAMYYMAVAAAEAELDGHLERADEIRTAELALVRHEAHKAAQKEVSHAGLSNPE